MLLEDFSVTDFAQRLSLEPDGFIYDFLGFSLDGLAFNGFSADSSG
jgi:hypothetical protein